MTEDYDDDEQEDYQQQYAVTKHFNDCFDGLIIEKWDLGPLHDLLRNKVLPKQIGDGDIDNCHEILKCLQKNSKIGFVALDKNVIGIAGLNTTKMWWSILWRSKVFDLCCVALTVMVGIKLFPDWF